MKEGVDCEQSKQDGVVVILIFFMATPFHFVAVHNYLPLLTQGTPSFITRAPNKPVCLGGNEGDGASRRDFVVGYADTSTALCLRPIAQRATG